MELSEGGERVILNKMNILSPRNSQFRKTILLSKRRKFLCRNSPQSSPRRRRMEKNGSELVGVFNSFEKNAFNVNFMNTNTCFMR